MYAELSHKQNRVHVQFREAPRKIGNPEEIQRKFARHEAAIRIFPNERNCGKLAEIVEEETGIRNFDVAVYKPKFNPKNMKYSRKETYRWNSLRRKK